jgi:hypothetical protein
MCLLSLGMLTLCLYWFDRPFATICSSHSRFSIRLLTFESRFVRSVEAGRASTALGNLGESIFWHMKLSGSLSIEPFD